ncbi:bifunctional 5,10-methylenetetrahydrofolate dehydrogenase/5,10-methenyltetrahydrofolate cyclohydrolase [Anoxynatronum buryatiense]|uniref:Bifunctional protein FolD n=1 Tax=Anoxynatronum buryatiense TaxID=489973 RepID=A0AA46AJE3_9CLOT|nr:bifunctional 5,10-methylenetetrahydrofolate dehydrogenase/5,10-methenyltetrahydrofolate cyclohydrolase [Anoxynatronum buryatiense]SMP60322.1 methenyltetrahydrofolate cyclohydrolase /5,10-methylenetetrahydrofolate dehydrogenase (NADP+) [Anoxynatronum buryatiense]
MATRLKGKPVADALSAAIREEVDYLKPKGVQPALTLIRAGEKPDDMAYERAIIKRCESVGVKVNSEVVPESISQADFFNLLDTHNQDPAVHGILIFRPLPKHLKEEEVQYRIAPEKDVDGFHPVNAGKLLTGDPAAFAPCTPMAVMEILKHYEVALSGKRAVVLGRSMVVGKPVALLLLAENATVTIAHSRTQDLEKVTSEADLLVAAIGRSEFVTATHIKKGAVVADVGINVDDAGNLTGDVAAAAAEEMAEAYTPVPGGVGSVTTAVLAKQVIKACKLQLK